MEPPQPGELQESAPNTHRQLGNNKVSRQEFDCWKTPGLCGVWLVAVFTMWLLGYPSTQKIPSAAADHLSQDQSAGKIGNPSTTLLAYGQRCWLIRAAL